jgi:hypothetical protein
MIRLLLRASLVGLVAGFALTQLETAYHLLAWEFLLVAVAVWEMREMPSEQAVEVRPLFTRRSAEPARLPRVISSTELMVMDAVSGRVTPDVRLQASLRQIASHRLLKRGIAMDTQAAVDSIGAEHWRWLMTPVAEVRDLAFMEGLVSTLEEK